MSQLTAPRVRAPAIVQASSLALDPEGFFAKHQKLGDPFIVSLPGLGEILASGHAEAAEQLFSAPPETFAPLPNNPVEPLLGRGSLILLAGEQHRRERKLISPSFRGERMRAYGALMCERARTEVDGWRTGDVISVQEAMRNITLDVILRAVLGINGEPKSSQFRTVVAAMLAAYTSSLLVIPALRRPLFGLSPWKRFAAARDAACALFRQEIEERRRHGFAEQEDILSLLMGATYDDGTPMGIDELVDELRTLIVGGHDTTTTALVWALHYVCTHPDALARLRAELAPLGPEPAPEALAGLLYIDAICQEALRLHPVVPVIPRLVLKSFEFRGQLVSPGQCVAVSTTLLHRQPDIWQNPDAFEPERFIGRKYSPFQFAPFGGGARRCVGAAFGAYQMRMVLGSMVARAHLESCTRVPPRRILSGITMGPASTICVRKVRSR